MQPGRTAIPVCGWEIKGVDSFEEAQQLAAEGWEPYAVTEGHTPWMDSDGDGGNHWNWFYLRRMVFQKREQEPASEHPSR